MNWMRPLAVMLVVGLCARDAAAQSQPLNDTGIMFSGDAATNSNRCELNVSTAQDCHNGRDRARFAGQLTKIGASTPNNSLENGLDYSKISNTGNVLPSSAVRGTGANEWGCTRDNVTGLIWEVKNASGFRGKDDTYTWYDAFAPGGNPGTPNGGTCSTPGECDTGNYRRQVNEAGLCGRNDWRIPTIRELQSIVDFGRMYPSIDTGYFPDIPFVFEREYWSDMSYAANASFAWLVSVNINRTMYLLKSSKRYIRLVRGGTAGGQVINNCVPTNPDSAYTNNGNGTVTDVRTGLMWKQCVEGKSGASCSGTASTIHWIDALTAAENATFAGYSDWRLPNVRELQSLIEYCNFLPAINGNYFPGTPSEDIWTGSPAIAPAGFPNNSSIIIDATNGANNESWDRTNVNYSLHNVRLVRSGQPFVDYVFRNGFD